MKIIIKTEDEIDLMRKGGQILAETLDEVCKYAKAGISTWELDQIAENLIRQRGATPGFKGYHGFPATICTAINDTIVHGIPTKQQILKEGDLFTVDCGVTYKKMNTDAARSVGIGQISSEKSRLIKTAYEALSRGTDAAQPGNHIGDISKAIAETIEKAGFKVIHNLTGHGVGHSLHEDPMIPNYWDGQRGALLKPGMTIAIEPIFSVSTHEMITLNDNWTIVTDDGSCSVQAENTVLICKNGNEILTVKN